MFPGAPSKNSNTGSELPWLAWSRGTVTPFPAELTVPQVFAQRVRKTPDALAVIDGETRWTYAELSRRAGQIARSLRRRGVRKGSFVGISAARSAGFVAGALGILEAGAAYVPIDSSEPEGRQALRKRDCTLVLNGTEPEETADPEGTEGEELNDPEAAAYVLYTSGSTGEPKGVVVPHRAITRLVCQTDYLTIVPDDIFAFHSNLSFDASTLELWGPLLNGASLVVTPTETVLSPSALARHLHQHGITLLWLTTSLFNRLATDAPAMFAGLRTLLFGGEAADAASIRRVLEHGRPLRLVNGYGPTETTTFAVCHLIEELDGDVVAIGRPIANTDAYILGPELQPVAEGELHIGGPGLAIGYLNQPQLTAERFVETPFGRLYKTGDLARWRPEGTLEYLGRKDRQVKIRGHRIEPGEIEAALRRQPGVRECAVLLRSSPAGEPILVGYVAGEADFIALREALRLALPAPMVPAALVRVTALPLNANGKLDHRALPDPELGHPELRPGYIAPRTPLEQRIAAVWQEVLGLPAAGIDDNFFDLGGNSLLLLRLHAGLAAALGQELRIVALFQHPSIRAQAQAFEAVPTRQLPQLSTAAQDRAAKQRAALARQRLLSKR